MGYLTDAPGPVREMVRVIVDFGQYRYDPASVFSDFVDYGVGCLSLNGDAELAAVLKSRYSEAYSGFHDLFCEWLQIMSREITEENRWFDSLGMVYEYLASRSKKGALGQFFTPPVVCDAITSIQSGTESRKLKSVNDPSCGSGRTLLSFNSQNPGNFMFGEDLDPVCAKMAAMNLTVHGCQGVVTCMDSLTQGNWKFSYRINHLHYFGGPPVPHLEPLTKEQANGWKAYLFSLGRDAVDQQEQDKAVDQVATSKGDEIPVKVSKHGQLSIF